MIVEQPSNNPNRFRVAHISAARTTEPSAGRCLRSLQLLVRRNKFRTGLAIRSAFCFRATAAESCTCFACCSRRQMVNRLRFQGARTVAPSIHAANSALSRAHLCG